MMTVHLNDYFGAWCRPEKYLINITEAFTVQYKLYLPQIVKLMLYTWSELVSSAVSKLNPTSSSEKIWDRNLQAL